MPNHKSAVKRIRQSERRRAYNRYQKVKAKRAMKAVREATNFEEASKALQTATQVLDRIASHGVIHKNFAANKKSKLARYVNSLKNG